MGANQERNYNPTDQELKMSYTRTYPPISIIMVNFNGFPYLKETIPPLLNLNYPNYEFIIIDNGSTDGSIEYINQFPNILLLKSPRYREKNYACNHAIKHAKGQYILLLDNDIIIIDTDILLKLFTMHESLKDVGALGLAVHDRGIPLSNRYGSYFGYYFIREIKKIPVQQIKNYHGFQVPATGGQIFIRKALWEKIGGYDDHLKFGGDDNDLGIRLSLYGYRNYIYTQTNQIHIGLAERLDNKKYPKKFRDTYYAHLYTIVKNYKTINMATALIVYPLFTMLKSVKQSFLRKHPGPLWAFFQGFWLFIKNLPYALNKRKEIQKKRIIKKDVYLTRPLQ